MATASVLSPSQRNFYSQSFLNQLESEWNEFLFDVGHSTVSEHVTNKINSANSEARKILTESLNKFNETPDVNIVIPVPLSTLKRLFSPSKCNADDVFKKEIFYEIKENLNLTKTTCRNLQKLLFSESRLFESSNEISDFPSPSIVSNFRKSAPGRLRSKKKPKSKLSIKNDIQLLNNKYNQKVQNILNFKIGNAIENSTNKKNYKLEFNNKDKIKNDGRNIHIQPKLQVNVEVSNKPNTVEISNKLNENIKNDTIRRKLLSSQKSRKDTSQQNKSLKKRQKNSSKLDVTDKQEFSSIYDLELRESSSLFLALKQPKKSVKPSIVCTYFSQEELFQIYRIVTELGFFDIENNVSLRTTHLICGSSKKTVNLCKAVARGCWILDKKWVFLSGKKGRWLYEEKFEKSGLMPAVMENRLKRQKCGSTYCCDIFSKVGSIFVSKRCVQPKAEDMKELILLGGGVIENDPEKASYIVGHITDREWVKETWVLNSILQGKCVDINKYIKNE